MTTGAAGALHPEVAFLVAVVRRVAVGAGAAARVRTVGGS
jgi:hypothetical protein